MIIWLDPYIYRQNFCHQSGAILVYCRTRIWLQFCLLSSFSQKFWSVFSLITESFGHIYIYNYHQLFPSKFRLGQIQFWVRSGPAGRFSAAMFYKFCHHSSPGHSSPGHSSPGHSSPGHISPGHSSPGHSSPGHSSPGHSSPGHSSPGHSSPGHS